MSIEKKSLVSGKATKKAQSISKASTGSPLVSNKTASKVSVARVMAGKKVVHAAKAVNPSFRTL